MKAIGVAGFKTAPAFLPSSWMRESTRCKWMVAEHIAAIADIAVPALRRSRFDCKARTNRRRQYRVAIFARLCVEELPTRHGNDAYFHLLRRKLLRCRDYQSDLRSGRDQNKLG